MSFKGLDDAGVPEPLFAIWLLASLVLPSMDGKRFWDVSQDYSF